MDKIFDVSAFAYAHRGLWGGAIPENSLAAFKAAAAAGVGCELDVRLTADGLPVVFHDPTLDRMCGDPRRVDQIAVESLASLKLPDGSSIPTLEDVLAAMADQPVLIELKVEGPTDLAERVAGLIEGHPGRMTVMSFDEPTVTRLCQLVTDRPVGLLIAPEPVLSADEVRMKAMRGRAVGCDYLAPHFTSLAIAEGAAGGLPLVTWTIRDPAALELAQRYGAAPIFEGFSAALAKPWKTPI